MARQWRRRRALARLAVVLVVALLAPLLGAVPARADSFVPISGAGSTWSFNALDAWRVNVRQYGMVIAFAATGSSDGRSQFYKGTVDFAVSEIPYGITDEGTGAGDPAPSRKFAYIPIVAGGTAFMYNLKIGGQRVTNLRLSGENLTKIFTGGLSYWDDPAIKVDNPQLALPHRKIVPVVRSDGSGTTAQFSLWMSKQYPSLWNAYCARAKRSTPCGLTSNYPIVPGVVDNRQNGSLGVAGYVADSNAEGAITYVEYSYAKNAHFPVVKVLNAANYYVEPTRYAVAVALTRATINSDLTQNLSNVYVYSDKRTYPLSSYSYMIIPLEPGLGVTTQKGATLAAFGYYFLCEGQQGVGDLGYSPLPINLVNAGLDQLVKVPGADASKRPVAANCHNPTLDSGGGNALANLAPNPPACDAKGSVQCATGTGGAPQNTNTGGGGGSSTSASPGAVVPSGSAAPGQHIDPDTGQVVADGGGGGGLVPGVPVTLAAEHGWQQHDTLMLVAVLLLLVLIAGPPLIARLRRNGYDEDDQ